MEKHVIIRLPIFAKVEALGVKSMRSVTYSDLPLGLGVCAQIGYRPTILQL